MDKSKNSSGSGAAMVFALFVFVAIAVFIFWGFGPGSYGEKATVWDYGHGEGTHRFASEQQIERFYKRVMAKAPNKRGRCQKYKKELMRYQEGYEYKSDSVWNKRYKEIIKAEMKAWKQKHGK